MTDVRGANVEDWKATAGKLKVNYTQRVLGVHRLDVTLEQAHKTFPAQISVAPVRLAGATKETAFIGAASAAGIRLKTETLTNSREIPVTQLSQRAGDEALAFTADAPYWRLALATERLPARVVAEVFNLVTVGDGLVGGSATIRFGILNQGVQEFKVRLPAHWKNVDFTGPNIRRKESSRGSRASPAARRRSSSRPSTPSSGPSPSKTKPEAATRSSSPTPSGSSSSPPPSASPASAAP